MDIKVTNVPSLYVTKKWAMPNHVNTHVQLQNLCGIKIPMDYLMTGLNGSASLGHFREYHGPRSAENVRILNSKKMLHVLRRLFDRLYTKKHASDMLIFLVPKDPTMRDEDIVTYLQIDFIVVCIELVDGGDDDADTPRSMIPDKFLSDYITENKERLTKEKKEAATERAAARKVLESRCKDNMSSTVYGFGLSSHDMSKICQNTREIARVVGAVTATDFELECNPGRFETLVEDCPFSLRENFMYGSSRAIEDLFGREWCRRDGDNFVTLSPSGGTELCLNLNDRLVFKISHEDTEFSRFFTNQLPDLSSIQASKSLLPVPKFRAWDAATSTHPLFDRQTLCAAWAHQRKNVQHEKKEFSRREEALRETMSADNFAGGREARRTKFKTWLLLNFPMRALSPDEPTIGRAMRGMAHLLQQTDKPLDIPQIRFANRNLTAQQNLVTWMFDGYEAMHTYCTHAETFITHLATSSMLVKVIEGRLPSVVLTGLPGGGKTRVLQCVMRLLPDYNVKKANHSSVLAMFTMSQNDEENWTQVLMSEDEARPSSYGIAKEGVGGKSATPNDRTDAAAIKKQLFSEKQISHMRSFESKQADGSTVRKTEEGAQKLEISNALCCNQPKEAFAEAFKRRLIMMVVYILKRVDKTFNECKAKEAGCHGQSETYESKLEEYFRNANKTTAVLQQLLGLVESLSEITVQPNLQSLDTMIECVRSELERRGDRPTYFDSYTENIRNMTHCFMHKYMVTVAFNHAESPVRKRVMEAAAASDPEEPVPWPVMDILAGLLEAERHGVLGDDLAFTMVSMLAQDVYPADEQLILNALKFREDSIRRRVKKWIRKKMSEEGNEKSEEELQQEVFGGASDSNTYTWIKEIKNTDANGSLRVEPVVFKHALYSTNDLVTLITSDVAGVQRATGYNVDTDKEILGGAIDSLKKRMAHARDDDPTAAPIIVVESGGDDARAGRIKVLTRKMQNNQTDTMKDVLKNCVHAYTRPGTKLIAAPLSVRKKDTNGKLRHCHLPQLTDYFTVHVHDPSCHVHLADGEDPDDTCTCNECVRKTAKKPTTWRSLRVDASTVDGERDADISAAVKTRQREIRHALQPLMAENWDPECSAATPEFMTAEIAPGRRVKAVPCTCHRSKIITINNIHYMNSKDRHQYTKTMPPHMQPKEAVADHKTRHKSYTIDCCPEDVAFASTMSDLGLDVSENYEKYHPFFNALTYVAQEDCNESYPETNMNEILAQFNGTRMNDPDSIGWKQFQQTCTNQGAETGCPARVLEKLRQKRHRVNQSTPVPLSAQQANIINRQQVDCNLEHVLLPEQHGVLDVRDDPPSRTLPEESPVASEGTVKRRRYRRPTPAIQPQ